MRDKTIKSVSNNRFSLRLIETFPGLYRIEAVVDGGDRVYESSELKDFNLAIDVFEAKLIELEGN